MKPPTIVISAEIQRPLRFTLPTVTAKLPGITSYSVKDFESALAAVVLSATDLLRVALAPSRLAIFRKQLAALSGARARLLVITSARNQIKHLMASSKISSADEVFGNIATWEKDGFTVKWAPLKRDATDTIESAAMDFMSNQAPTSNAATEQYFYSISGSEIR